MNCNKCGKPVGENACFCESCGALCGGFSYGAWALGVWATVIVAHRLSCPVACGIFPDHGSNP